MNLTVVHHIPGRIRWRSANCFTRSLAETIAEKLDAITGVEGVRVSPALRLNSYHLLHRERTALGG